MFSIIEFETRRLTKMRKFLPMAKPNSSLYHRKPTGSVGTHNAWLHTPERYQLAKGVAER